MRSGPCEQTIAVKMLSRRDYTNSDPFFLSSPRSGGYGMVSVADMAGKEAWMTTRPADSTGPDGRCIRFSVRMVEGRGGKGGMEEYGKE